jgi:hypothetical protein
VQLVYRARDPDPDRAAFSVTLLHQRIGSQGGDENGLTPLSFKEDIRGSPDVQFDQGRNFLPLGLLPGNNILRV